MAPFFQQDLDSVSPLTCLGCESDRVFFASLSTRRLGPIQLQLCYYRYLNFTGTSCPTAQLSISTNPTRKGVSFTREEKDLSTSKYIKTMIDLNRLVPRSRLFYQLLLFSFWHLGLSFLPLFFLDCLFPLLSKISKYQQNDSGNGRMERDKGVPF